MERKLTEKNPSFCFVKNWFSYWQNSTKCHAKLDGMYLKKFFIWLKFTIFPLLFLLTRCPGILQSPLNKYVPSIGSSSVSAYHWGANFSFFTFGIHRRTVGITNALQGIFHKRIRYLPCRRHGFQFMSKSYYYSSPEKISSGTIIFVTQ